MIDPEIIEYIKQALAVTHNGVDSPLIDKVANGLASASTFLSGTVTLVYGSPSSVTITDSKIKSTSIIVASYKAFSFSGANGLLQAACSNGSALIRSTSNTDNSDVNYIILL